MSQDFARFARPATLPGVELVCVAYRDRAFPTHMHAEYVAGVVTAGAEVLETGGARHVVAAGDVLQLNPGQAHANWVHGADALHYRVFYLPAEAIQPYLADDRPPVFDRPVMHGHPQAQALADSHAALARTDSGPLEQQTALMNVLRILTGTRPAEATLGACGGAAIDRVRAYIDAHFTDDFGLPALAAVADLSVFHLARRFKAAIGMSPLAYRNLRRVHEARRRLLAGGGIADIALDLGFADQSHLTRSFQKVIGISPARYRQQ